jgi:isopentenyl-diphosphate Delta-isomerase
LFEQFETTARPTQPRKRVQFVESDIGGRKKDHIQLAVAGDVGFREKTTLMECVRLIHDALPDLSLDEIDPSLTVLGKRLRAPLIIAAMTGGTAQAQEINKQLAEIAEKVGIGFGLGSQRAMVVNASTTASFSVRERAPSALVLGNVGIVQARSMTTSELQSMVDQVGVDALCVHLNPAMEMIQPGGDRDFSGGEETLKRLVEELKVPVIVKETGCGLSPKVLRSAARAGVKHVDVSGAGGTSWVAVETHRASGAAKARGELFWDWGIPTAASVVFAAQAKMQTVIATGGVRDGLDVAKSLVLGGTMAGVARPVLQVLVNEGSDAAQSFLLDMIETLKVTMLLVGARDLKALREKPKVITGELRTWLDLNF